MRILDTVVSNAKLMDHGVDPSQFCRCCPRATARIVVSLAELNEISKAHNGDVSSAMCQPDVARELRRVHADRTLSVMGKQDIGPIARHEEICADGTVKIHLTRQPKKAVVVLVDSCGQQVLDKCRTCARFRPTVVQIPGGTNANGRVFATPVVLGGYCSIEKEGIEVDGRIVFCDKRPLRQSPVSQQRTCSTCAYNTSYSEPMLNHAQALQYDLTRFEMDQIRIACEQEDDYRGVGLGIAQARLDRAKVHFARGPHTKNGSLANFGLLKTYLLRIEKRHVATVIRNNKEVEVTTGVTAIIPGVGDKVYFSMAESDDRVGLITLVSDHEVVLQILSPYHRRYRLDDRDTIRRPRPEMVVCPHCRGHKNKAERWTSFEVYNANKGSFEWAECSRCGGSGSVAQELFSTRSLSYVDSSKRRGEYCLLCTPQRACYWHAKSPLQKEEVVLLPLPLTGEIEKTRAISYECLTPGANTPIIHEPADRRVRLERDDSGVHVKDHRDQPPDFFLFRLWYRNLMSWCKNRDERRQVLAQFCEAKTRVRTFNNAKPIQVAWTLAAPVEAWHPVCEAFLYSTQWRHGRTRYVPHYWFPRYSHGGNLVIDDRVPTMGLDFTRLWNDQFGTPRSDRSTNTIIHGVGGHLTGLARPAHSPFMGRYRDGTPQILRIDEKFSWPRWQENEDWLRITSPGELLHDEIIASEHHLRVGREARAGQPFVGMPEAVTVTRHGFGVPNTAIAFESPRELMNWLDEPRRMRPTMESEEWLATNRFFALGYELFRNSKPLREDDVPSLYEFNHDIRPHGDPRAPEEESAGYFACSDCFDPQAGGQAGMYLPHEVDKVDLSCPNPECNGVLIFIYSREEWEAGDMQVDANTIEDWEVYRRKSGSPDSVGWLQQGRLMAMSCVWWKRRWTR